jgi:hypothetical protein
MARGVHSNGRVAGVIAEAFFSGNWQGRAEVRTLFGAKLRACTVAYQGAWSQSERGFRMEEQVVYDNGRRLDRTWLVYTDEAGGLLGLEATQAARMVVIAREGGFVARYDRLRMFRAPNVTNVELTFAQTPDGGLEARGWTRILGLPLLRTRMWLHPVLPESEMDGSGAADTRIT